MLYLGCAPALTYAFTTGLPWRLQRHAHLPHRHRRCLPRGFAVGLLGRHRAVTVHAPATVCSFSACLPPQYACLPTAFRTTFPAFAALRFARGRHRCQRRYTTPRVPLGSCRTRTATRASAFTPIRTPRTVLPPTGLYIYACARFAARFRMPAATYCRFAATPPRACGSLPRNLLTTLHRFHTFKTMCRHYSSLLTAT